MSHDKLQLAFAGTPELARVVLESLIDTKQYDIGIVFTKPDRPSGRGRKLKQSEVKKFAIANNIPVFQPENSQEIESYSLEDYDLLLVVAYGLLLPSKVLIKPKFGCINIHTSLLPRWRGAAPIQRAIEAGDKKTGITLMQIEEEMDTGPVLMQIICKINDQDTSGSLHDRLAKITADNINEALEKIIAGKLNITKQDNTKATYANKITKQERKLDWNKPAKELERKIRAYNPSPIAYTTIKGINIKIWEAKTKPTEKNLAPGAMLNEKSTLDIMTSKDLLSITKLQIPGKNVISAKDFLNGYAEIIKDNINNL